MLFRVASGYGAAESIKPVASPRAHGLDIASDIAASTTARNGAAQWPSQDAACTLSHRSMMRLLLVLLAMAWLTSAAAQIAPPDRWEADIAAFEAADRSDPPAAGGVVFIGSSSIRLWDTLQQDFPGTPIIQRGFGGSEIRDATRHARRIVVPYRPRLVVLYAGDNDLSEGRTPQQVREDFAAFVERVRRDLPDVAIAFIAIKPSPARANLLDAARRANALVEAYANTQRAIRTIDIFTPMLGADGQPRPELFGPDALHMNRAGYDEWVEHIAPALGSATTP